MRKKSRSRKMMAVVLAVTGIVSLMGCGIIARPLSAQNLMEGIEKRKETVDKAALQQDTKLAVKDFAIRLFQNCYEEEKNVLISPLSVMSALAMTAGGAGEETLSQMELVLGDEISDIAAYLDAYVNTLPQGEKYRLSVANSIWLRDDEKFQVKQEFLQNNKDYFDAGIYKAPLDMSTVLDINQWIKEKTEGMIGDMVNEIPEETMMYLINAIAFEAEWRSVYQESQIRDGIFTTENGVEQKIKLMYCKEYQYLENEKLKGFVKSYKEGQYAFVALLPKEEISLTEGIESLNGEALEALLANPKDIVVKTSLPQFEVEYKVQMKEILKEMGMTDAFDMELADFENLGSYTEGNIYLNNVIHEGYIKVDAKGTKAGAVTIVDANGAAGMPQEEKEVYLDRPFLYMIIDGANRQPIFIGTVTDME